MNLPFDITERNMTSDEFKLECAGFARHALEFGNPQHDYVRFGFVASIDDRFTGASSGLAYPHTKGYADWFQLTDLFVDKEYRGRGLGSELLLKLEQRVAGLGIGHIWTWTAGYEGPGFYLKHGYTIYLEKPNFYESGHARVGMQKVLRTGLRAVST